jgi:hypothetical protein
MAAINYYIGASRGSDLKPSAITVGTSSTSTLDVELRMQVQNASSAATGLTKLDVINIIRALKDWIESGGDGQNFSGANLPPI